MFSPLILICSIYGQCHTPAAPVFAGRELCEAETEAYILNIEANIPDNMFVVDWACHEWSVGA